MSLDPSTLQDPPMSSFTFSIYHRGVFEKSKFKDYDSLLINMLDRSEVRASYLASIFDDDRDVKKGADTTLMWGQGVGKVSEKAPRTTSTYCDHGEYVASFLLGSNQVRNFMQIDTGSDLLWWQCGPCEANKCYKQVNPLYDSTKSKTFQKMDCIYGSRCYDSFDTTYTCNIYDHECKYNIGFASGERSKGFMADDVITFVLDHQSVLVTFGCGKDQSSGRSSFSNRYSGLVGLGRRLKVGSYSLPSQFGADLMSICLPWFYSGKGSSLSFHITPWRRTTSAKLLINQKFPLFYFVNLYKIFIGDKLLPVHPSWWKFTKGGRKSGVTVDTGTTITNFPLDLYIVFRYLFRREVGDIPVVKGPHKSLDTCYKDDPKGRPLYFPDVKLYFGEVTVYLMNRLPSPFIDGKSPYEVLFSKAPSLAHLRVLGCSCYASTLPKADKFSERSRPAVLMGEVTFQENVLPFAKMSSLNHSNELIQPYTDNWDDANSLVSADHDDDNTMSEESSQDVSELVPR
ncbi:putative aspartic proteinase nepenthesin-2-like [Capsicum annuum]|nr:putative aspartic proteinase nepenthesin-2-like [Capsicum annuum]